ncbi:unnamed protein product [Cochlearia groenlandica]
MAKTGRKLRNCTVTSEAEDSTTKDNTPVNPEVVRTPVNPEVVRTPSKSFPMNRNDARLLSSHDDLFEKNQSPYMIRSTHHPGLSFVSHTLDGSNYNN